MGEIETIRSEDISMCATVCVQCVFESVCEEYTTGHKSVLMSHRVFTSLEILFMSIKDTRMNILYLTSTRHYNSA